MKKLLFLISLIFSVSLFAVESTVTVSDSERLETLDQSIKDHVDSEEYDEARKLIHIYRHLDSVKKDILRIKTSCKVISEELEDGSIKKTERRELRLPRNLTDYDFITLQDRYLNPILPVSYFIENELIYNENSIYIYKEESGVYVFYKSITLREGETECRDNFYYKFEVTLF